MNMRIVRTGQADGLAQIEAHLAAIGRLVARLRTDGLDTSEDEILLADAADDVRRMREWEGQAPPRATVHVLRPGQPG